MSLNEIRSAYERGELTKIAYFVRMQAEHARFNDYASFLRTTALSSICIEEERTVFTTRQHGIKIECDPSDMGVPPIVALNLGDYETQDGAMLINLVENGMTFFDIGANLGWYGLHVAKLNPRSRVFAFEPIPKTFGYLKSNVTLNGLPNMQVFPFGLFSESSERVFFVNPEVMGAASTSEMTSGAGEPERCRVRTLDDIVSELRVDVDFIKADVEGAELFVIRGGLETIKRCKPVVFAEMLRKHSATFKYHPNEIINLLREIGYGCFVCGGPGLREFSAMDDETVETNFVFLHAEKHRGKIEHWTAAAAGQASAP